MPSEDILNEPLVVDTQCLIAALVEILPKVLPLVLQEVLLKEHIQQIVATLLIELPETHIHILRAGLQENALLKVASKMVQEYTNLITQIMSGKVQMSLQARSLIKTEGLFKALDYMQMESASNKSVENRRIFNIWNETPVSGTPRIQETCPPEVMLSIMTALFTMGMRLKSEKNESPMSLAPVQGTLEETKVSGSDEDSESNLVKIHENSKVFF